MNLHYGCTFKGKDETIQEGDDDRELLSRSLTQSEQLYVCTNYLSFSLSSSSSSSFSLFRRFVCSKIVLAVICACVCRVLDFISYTQLPMNSRAQLSR